MIKPPLMLIFLTLLYHGTAFAGEYKLSNGWPTGIHAHIYSLPEEQKADCRKIGQALNLKSFNKPVMCRVTRNSSSEQIRTVEWAPLSEDDVLSFAKLNYEFSRKNSGNEFSWTAEREKFHKDKLAAGNLLAFSADIPLFDKSRDVKVVKVTSGTCNDDTEKYYESYLYLEEDQQYAQIREVFYANEIFFLNDQAYMISHTTRHKDDSFQYRLDPPQKIIFISKPARQSSYSRKYCRFIFWD